MSIPPRMHGCAWENDLSIPQHAAQNIRTEQGWLVNWLMFVPMCQEVSLAPLSSRPCPEDGCQALRAWHGQGHVCEGLAVVN